MDVHHCLICLGSNYEYGKRLEAARQALKLHFPDIVFGKEMETEAIGGTGFVGNGNFTATGHHHTKVFLQLLCSKIDHVIGTHFLDLQHNFSS